MVREDLESKLTPAARQVLDEFLDETRSQVLERARSHAIAPTGELDEISVRDVVDGLTEVRGYGLTKPTMTRILATASLLIALLGTLGFVTYFLLLDAPSGYRLSLEVGIALVTAVLGLAATFGFQLLQMRRDRGLNLNVGGSSLESDYESAFLRNWVELELLARSVAAEDLGESKANAPIKEVFRDLSRAGRLGGSDLQLAEKLLKLRNVLVHSGDISSSDARRGIEEIKQLSRKLGDRMRLFGYQR